MQDSLTEIDPETLQPYGDYVFIKMDKTVKETKSGIILPDNIKEPSVWRSGTVVRCGPGKRDHNGKRTPINLKPGQKCVWKNFGNNWQMLKDKNEDPYIMVQAEHIEFTLPEDWQP